MEQLEPTTLITDTLSIGGTPVVRLENDHLIVDVAPSIGGRILGISEKKTSHQFLWRNRDLKLQKLEPGSSYDPNFYGGIDEIIPNDNAEEFNGKSLSDHGELWTTPLTPTIEGETLTVEGDLPVSGLHYKKTVSLRKDSSHCDLDYEISNPTGHPIDFQWKLHPAVNINEGDTIICPAESAQVADLDWSRFTTVDPFKWPEIEGLQANLIPLSAGTTDSFYLWDLASGIVSWQNAAETLCFGLCFDTDVFPYVYYFASYGGFGDHTVAILEPCTAMPVSLNESAAKGQCATLQPGEVLETRVAIYAGSMSPERS